MADCSLYEIPSFLNLFLRNSGCSSVEQNRAAEAVGFVAVMISVCLSSAAVHRSIWMLSLRESREDKDFLYRPSSPCANVALSWEPPAGVRWCCGSFIGGGN